MSDQTISYLLCPACGRAVPDEAQERFCINDGTELLAQCAHCGHRVTSPYARHCPGCGARYGEPAVLKGEVL